MESMQNYVTSILIIYAIFARNWQFKRVCYFEICEKYRSYVKLGKEYSNYKQY